MVMLRHYCIIGLLSFHRFICSFIFISQLNTVNGLLSFLTTGHNKIQFPSKYWAMKCATRFNKTLNIKQERNRIEIENATVCLYCGGECDHRPSGEPTSEFQRPGPYVRPHVLGWCKNITINDYRKMNLCQETAADICPLAFFHRSPRIQIVRPHTRNLAHKSNA